MHRSGGATLTRRYHLSDPQAPCRIVAQHPQHVMAALVAAIHVFVTAKEGVDGRHKAGHDDVWPRRRFEGQTC